MKVKKPIGIVLWEGKSLLDGQRIMAIATGMYGRISENSKTGQMIQTYILRRDIHPMLARRMGEDFSVCGNCMHREQSTCYVNLAHGPIKIFWAYLDKSYKDFEPQDIELFKGKNIRIGSYGDPAAVPYEIWENICKVSNHFTGYTHQWPTCDQRLKNLCMASVDTIQGFMQEYDKARAMGWRTFRVRESMENPVQQDEFVCPASKEAGKLTVCEKCCACSGLSAKTSKNPVIELHADSDALSNWRHHRFMRIMKKRKAKHAWRRDYTIERKMFKKICSF
jgi:hypothetical protein